MTTINTDNSVEDLVLVVIVIVVVVVSSSSSSSSSSNSSSSSSKRSAEKWEMELHMESRECLHDAGNDPGTESAGWRGEWLELMRGEGIQ